MSLEVAEQRGGAAALDADDDQVRIETEIGGGHGTGPDDRPSAGTDPGSDPGTDALVSHLAAAYRSVGTHRRNPTQRGDQVLVKEVALWTSIWDNIRSSTEPNAHLDGSAGDWWRMKDHSE
jgi:hypothetical protein